MGFWNKQKPPIEVQKNIDKYNTRKWFVGRHKSGLPVPNEIEVEMHYTNKHIVFIVDSTILKIPLERIASMRFGMIHNTTGGNFKGQLGMGGNYDYTLTILYQDKDTEEKKYIILHNVPTHVTEEMVDIFNKEHKKKDEIEEVEL